MEKVCSLGDLLPVREDLRRAGKRLVFTNGCFDLLHLGHVRCLEQARALGDCLVVGLNSDASVRRLKGRGRPLFPWAARAEVLAALACLDYVVGFDQDTAEGLVKALRPEVYVKGGDYQPGGKPLPEAAAVEEYGGQVVILPLVPGYSTSELIGRLREGLARP